MGSRHSRPAPRVDPSAPPAARVVASAEHVAHPERSTMIFAAAREWEAAPGGLEEKRRRRCGVTAQLIGAMDDEEVCPGRPSPTPPEAPAPGGYAGDEAVAPAPLIRAWHTGGWAWLSHQGWEAAGAPRPNPRTDHEGARRKRGRSIWAGRTKRCGDDGRVFR